MADNEINALIQLLDDPDKEVFEHVFSKLKSYGDSIIPQLESAWETSLDIEMQHRVELLIHKIQFDSLKDKLFNWAKNDNENLLEGALLVCRYQFPELNENEIREEIARIEQSIWLELNQYLTSFEQIHVFNKVFYDNYGFGGSPGIIKDPNAYFLNKVVESKRGTPLSLGTMYLILGERLHLPVFGVNLPKHFILAYCNEEDISYWTMMNNPGHILFYINPLQKGNIISLKEIDELKLKYPQISKHSLLPCSKKDIIQLHFAELKEIYAENGNSEKSNEMEMLIQLLREAKQSKEA